MYFQQPVLSAFDRIAAFIHKRVFVITLEKLLVFIFRIFSERGDFPKYRTTMGVGKQTFLESEKRIMHNTMKRRAQTQTQGRNENNCKCSFFVIKA